MIFDDRQCILGEGPLWHPKRQQLLWFDIIGRRLLTRDKSGPKDWAFDGHVSAAGWVDKDSLLIASDSGLHHFNLQSGKSDLVVAMEDDNPITRSNDGRADPWGGFWIGTMGIKLEDNAGAIYRYYRGELRQLYAPLTVPNAICFSPDRRFAYFTDTPTGIIRRQRLSEASGWPMGEAEEFIDLTAEGWHPDGAVVDTTGTLWNAQWQGRRVAAYDTNGAFLRAVDLPALQTTCPAFGGPDLTTLFCTSAAENLDGPNEGQTFGVPDIAPGQSEHQVVL